MEAVSSPRIAWVWLFWLVGGMVGCGVDPPVKQGEPIASQPAVAILDPTAPLANGMPMQAVTGPRPPASYLLAIRLSFFRVEVPYGLASSSERLWRYLDEEIADPQTLSALHRNGFRIGRGRIEEWEPVGKLLREMAGRALDRTECLAMPGRAEPIVLQEHRDHQRIFVFNHMGRLVGQDYPPGDNVLMLTCHLNDEDPSEVILQGVPLVRSAKKVARWEKTDAGYQLTRSAAEAPVGPLEFTVKMARGAYAVIGPGAGVARDTSPACCFLISEKDGLRYETLLVVVPEVFAAPA